MAHATRWPLHTDRHRVVFDLDGVLLKEAMYPEFGAPAEEMIRLAKTMQAEGWEVIVSTARLREDDGRSPEARYMDVLRKLDEIGLRVEVEAKTPGDIYIDDRGLFSEPGLLYDFIQLHQLGPVDWSKAMACGDLVGPLAMNVYDVPQNPVERAFPQPGADRYRMLLPFTGGLDSSTLLNMAVESSVNFVPVYLDMGQDYAEVEIRQARAIANFLGAPEVVVHEVKRDFARWDYILAGRNAVIIMALAEMARLDGYWGDIWFGSLAGESPMAGGDKSHLFFSHMQRVLHMAGYDVQIQRPLIGMDKTDLVRYWTHDIANIDVLGNVKSCFHPEELRCGKCQTCFRYFVALHQGGVGEEVLFELFPRDQVDFQQFADRYTERMQHGEWQKNGYSRSRVDDTLRTISWLKRERLVT